MAKYRVISTFYDEVAGNKWYKQGETAEFDTEIAKDLVSARVISPILDVPKKPVIETADKSLGNENATKKGK